MLNLNNIRLIAPYSVKGIKSTGLWELESYLKNRPYCSLDLETNGLDTFTSKIIMLQLGDNKKQFVIDVRFQDKESLDFIYNLIKDKCLVGQNIKFDIKFVKYHYGWEIKRVFDVMLAEKLLNNNKFEESKDGFYGLASIAERYLGAQFNPSVKSRLTKGKKKLVHEQGSLFPEYSFSKAVRDEFSKVGNKPFTLQQVVYGANDVWMPYLIRRKQMLELRKVGMNALSRLENDYTIALADIELNGVYLDKDKWIENYNSYLDKEQQALDKLKEILDINWNSSKQVGTYFKELGIPIKVVDKKKSYGEIKFYKDTVQATHIKKYAKDWNIIDNYLSYKGLQKLTSSYGEKFLRYIHPITRRVHSNFMQIVTTGRTSSNSPNCQNIPSKEDCEGFRECFIPENDNVFVMSDYSSQEVVILADSAKEKAMIEFFESKDTDMHSYTARRMFNIPVSKKENPHLRQLGKILGFSVAYGASAFKVSETFQVPLQEAQGFIDKYYKSYPDLKIHFEKGHKNVFKRGYILVDEKYKRRVYIKDYEEFKNLHNFIETRKLRGQTNIIPKKVWSRYYTLKGSIERDSQNYPIQGLAANQTKLATVLFYRWTIDKKIAAKLVLTIHDELGVECSKKDSNKVSKALKVCMEGAGELTLSNNLLKIKANPIIADYWKH